VALLSSWVAALEACGCGDPAELPLMSSVYSTAQCTIMPHPAAALIFRSPLSGVHLSF
jgi:hypothetical protein